MSVTLYNSDPSLLIKSYRKIGNTMLNSLILWQPDRGRTLNNVVFFQIENWSKTYYSACRKLRSWATSALGYFDSLTSTKQGETFKQVNEQASWQPLQDSSTWSHLLHLPDVKGCSHIIRYAAEEICILVSEVSTGLQDADQYFERTPMDIIFKNELSKQALPDVFEHKNQDTQYLKEGEK